MNDIHDLPGIRWWLRQRSRYHLRSGLMVLSISLILGSVFFIAGRDQLETKEFLFLLCFFGFFLFFGCSQLLLWFRGPKIRVRKYWYGTIVDTRCIRSSKKKIRSYRISADVNGKIMDGVCVKSTYDRAEIGQTVVLFQLEGDKTFCVHPDM